MDLLEVGDELTEHAEVEVNQSPCIVFVFIRHPLFGQTKVLKERKEDRLQAKVAPRLFGVVDVGKGSQSGLEVILRDTQTGPQPVASSERWLVRPAR